METPIIPTFMYGYYGYNVFELPVQNTSVALLPKVDKDSRVNTTFNIGSKSVLVDIDINTGDYYDAQTNEGDYTNLINFIKTNQIGTIPKISPTVKVLVDYTIKGINGATIDAGVRVSEVPMSDCITVMPITNRIIAPYRIAKYIKTEFVLNRFNLTTGPVARTFMPLGHCCNDNTAEKFFLYINSVRVLGTETGKEKLIPKCMNGGHYAEGCQTIMDIERNSIELFSSVWYDLSFNSHGIPGYATSISIPIEIVTPMIVTTDTTEIDALLASNAENFYPGDVPGEIIVDMFKPLIQRPHCPGVLPHDYFKYWEPKHHHCDCTPDHHGNGSCSHPICPGPEWPDHGNLVKIDVNSIDENTPPGVYTNGGVMKYSWKDLLDNEAILKTYKGSFTVISTPDASIRGAKITASDIGPILVIPAPTATTAIAIGESAFFGYENLEVVYLPKEAQTIYKHAFYGCKNLEAVHVKSDGTGGICHIQDNAFMNCTNLRSISTSIALNTIGERAFYHCSLLTLTVPPSVGTVGENAFHEVFRVICSPKADLTGTGINPKDVEFFTEDSPYYNPEDYVENPGGDEGGSDNGGNTGDSGSEDTNSDNTGETTGDAGGTDSGSSELPEGGTTGTGSTEDGGSTGNTDGGEEEASPVTPHAKSSEEGSGEV